MSRSLELLHHARTIHPVSTQSAGPPTEWTLDTWLSSCCCCCCCCHRNIHLPALPGDDRAVRASRGHSRRTSDTACADIKTPLSLPRLFFQSVAEQKLSVNNEWETSTDHEADSAASVETRTMRSNSRCLTNETNRTYSSVCLYICLVFYSRSFFLYYYRKRWIKMTM